MPPEQIRTFRRIYSELWNQFGTWAFAPLDGAKDEV